MIIRAVKANYRLQALLDRESELRRQRLMKLLNCTTSYLVRAAFVALEESLKRTKEAAE